MATNTPATSKNNQLAKKQATPSERFTQAVMREFPNGGSQELKLTSFQRKLIQNYFIKLDGSLKDSEVKRYGPTNDLEYKWENVNLNKLAQDVVAYSSIGLDPLQKNHINPIPYKNSKTNKYDITFIEGYNGLELKAKKYGLEVPDDVIFKLKYSNDKFKALPKDVNREVESYEFDIVDSFDRGDLQGGFYYKVYKGSPEKNTLKVMTRSDIEKRRPEYAAAEFWGGEKDNWEYDERKKKRVKKGKTNVDGWEEEMFLKTLKRHCWNSIVIDSQKIDDHLLRILENEAQLHDRNVSESIADNANKKSLKFEDVEDAEHEEVNEKPKAIAEAKPSDEEMQKLHDQAMEEEAQQQPKKKPGF
tara:strand:+ start:217 stop:1296 length:1080 start_codon:yes stop_codon:yes gene_type:complete